MVVALAGRMTAFAAFHLYLRAMGMTIELLKESFEKKKRNPNAPQTNSSFRMFKRFDGTFAFQDDFEMVLSI